MKRLLLLSVVVTVAAIPVQVFGGIVYSGSQNVVLQLTPSNSTSSIGINIAEQGEQWDDFRVNLWLDMSMMSTMSMSGMMAMGTPMAMTTAESRLAILLPPIP